MRVLLLTQVVPFPPDSGPKIKTYNMLQYLAQRHEVHLASFVRSPAEEAGARALEAICSGVTTVPLRRSRMRDAFYLARSLAHQRSFLVERDDSRPMRAAIERLLREQRFDAVHADQLTMAQFAIDLRVPLRVLDEHNAVWTIVQRAAARDSLWPRRALAEIEWRKLRSYEGEVCRRFDVVTVVSDDDRRALEEAAGERIAAETIPIAVDTRELAYTPRTAAARHVLSVATMFYPPNVEAVHWFATEIFPMVRRAVPGTNFLAVGSRPPRAITEMPSAENGVVVTGYVGDLEPVLRESAVLVVPVHAGSGMRVKILEAFARGIPVVSTTIGVEGIDARPGEHLLVADEPADFAAAVICLLRDPAESARIAGAARGLVEARYDWRAALRGLDTLYAPVASGGPVAQRVQASAGAAREEAQATQG